MAGMTVTASREARLTPNWVGPLYLVLAVLLVPWTIYLGVVLPDHTTSAHWDVAWVGFDVMELLALGLTGLLAYRRSSWVELAAMAAAVLLVVDAWFDITTARGAWNVTQAVILGVGIELPLAGLSLWLARRVETSRR
jgi:hypothetical protein